MKATIIEEFGMHKADGLMVAHMQLKKGNSIEEHNHPGYNIFFTPVKGKLEVTIAGSEKYEAYPGKIINFNGEDTISARVLEDCEVFVYLVQI